MKTCKKHKELAEENIYIYYSRKGTKCYRCKLCMNETSKRTYKRMGAHEGRKKRYNINEYQARYLDKVKHTNEFKEKRKKYYPDVKKWRDENKTTHAYKVKRRESEKKQVLQCYPSYIKKLMKTKGWHTLTQYPVVVDTYANILKVKREVKKQVTP